MPEENQKHEIDISITWAQYVHAMLTTWEHLNHEGRRIAMNGMMAMAYKLDQYESEAENSNTEINK